MQRSLVCLYVQGCRDCRGCRLTMVRAHTKQTKQSKNGVCSYYLGFIWYDFYRLKAGTYVIYIDPLSTPSCQICPKQLLAKNVMVKQSVKNVLAKNSTRWAGGVGNSGLKGYFLNVNLIKTLDTKIVLRAISVFISSNRGPRKIFYKD